MTTPPESPTARRSPASENFSTALTATESELPTCDQCLEILESLPAGDDRTWPPVKKLSIPCHGWPDLANIMSQNPGFESFQAFRDLHIKSLLYYQAQLVELRQDIHKLEWKDHSEADFPLHERLSKSVDFLLKTESNAGSNSERSKQIVKVKEMRNVLKEYSKHPFQSHTQPFGLHLLIPIPPQGEAMLLYTKINELPEPETFCVNNLLKWLRTKDYPIDGPGKDSWGELLTLQPKLPSIWSSFFRLVRTIFWTKDSDKLRLDLVVPYKNKNVDGFTRWIETEGVPFWDRVCVAWKTPREPAERSEMSATLPPPSPDRGPRRPSSASGTTIAQWLSDIRRKVSISSLTSEKPAPEDGSPVDGKFKIVTYRYRTLLAFTTFATTVFASLLPIVAIVVLSKVHRQPMILGFIALFTGLFTMGLMILTPPGTSRTEIFTASSA
jgi:hypothetical protein